MHRDVSASSAASSSSYSFLKDDPNAKAPGRTNSNGKKERPKTCYEDFEKGQKKLLTSASHTYDIMPDIAMLTHFAPEKDDAMHDPGRRLPTTGDDHRIGEPRHAKQCTSFFSGRAILNAGSLVFLLTCVSYDSHTQDAVRLTRIFSRFFPAHGHVCGISSRYTSHSIDI